MARIRVPVTEAEGVEEAQSLEQVRPLIVDLLVADRRIEQKDIEAVYQFRAKEGGSVEHALISTGLVSDDEIAEVYSRYMRVELVDLEKAERLTTEEAKALLPEKLIRDLRLVPLSLKDGALELAVVDPSDLGALHQIQLYCGLTPVFRVAPLRQVERVLVEMLGKRNMVSEIVLESAVNEAGLDPDFDDDVLDLDRPIVDTPDTQVIRMVNHVLRQAISERASDIHIEPRAHDVAIRFRVDGQLHVRPAPPRSLYLPLLSRLKVIARMDIAERRLPQDGGFSIKHRGEQTDVRVSTIPTIFGQKMVLRILSKDSMLVNFESLGMSKDQRERFVNSVGIPNGLTFVTGPTGSGKSTTLYAALSMLNSPDKNIVTIEDPVEYKLEGVNQVQVHKEIGLTFSDSLRSFLRQDPDVIMVGEVRDQETAQICLRAALVGRLVLSTLHTNSALGAVDRLFDMGLEPFLIASPLRLVEAQRLIRRLCDKCKEPIRPDMRTSETYRLDPGKDIFRARGCDACNDVGYRGRVGIFEVVEVSRELRSLIQRKASLQELREQASREGIMTLFESGLEKVRSGSTTLEEVVKSTLAGED